MSWIDYRMKEIANSKGYNINNGMNMDCIAYQNYTLTIPFRLMGLMLKHTLERI